MKRPATAPGDNENANGGAAEATHKRKQGAGAPRDSGSTRKLMELLEKLRKKGNLTSDEELNNLAVSTNGDAQPGPLDPFNPANLRISPDYLAQGAVKKLLTTVPVRRPSPRDFIRVHPEEAYRLSPVRLIDFKEEREVYLVTNEYPGVLEEALPFTLYLAINRQKVPFIWHVRIPGTDGRTSQWFSSAHELAELAMKFWIRVVSNLSLGGYEALKAENQFADPEWPKKLSFPEILRIAFKDHVVTAPDHPVIKRLRGAI